MAIPDALRALVERAPIAHVVTLDPDGTPHVSVAWIGLDGEELVFATMRDQRKLRNLRRDPRLTLSLETGERTDMNLDGYVVLHGTARITEGGAADLLQELAHRYMGPGVRFPNMPDPPPGYIVRFTPATATGNAPWVRQIRAARTGDPT